MFEISKIRMRRLYKTIVYGLTLYGLFNVGKCTGIIHSENIKDKLNPKQKIENIYEKKKEDLEKIIDRYNPLKSGNSNLYQNE